MDRIRYFLCLLLLLNKFPLEGTAIDYDFTPEVASTEGLPSSLVGGTVCAITGEYIESFVDIELVGPETLKFQRNYGSFSGWSYDHDNHLIVSEISYKDEPSLLLCLCNRAGSKLDYIHTWNEAIRKKQKVAGRLVDPKGLTNGAACLSGKSNLKNQKVYTNPDQLTFHVTLPSGDKALYKKSHVTEQGWAICPKRMLEKTNRSVYSYVEDTSQKPVRNVIKCKNRKTGQTYSEITHYREERDGKEQVIFKTDEGRSFSYDLKKHKIEIAENGNNRSSISTYKERYITRINSLYSPSESYEYAEKTTSQYLQMSRKTRPDDRFLITEYYKVSPTKVKLEGTTFVADNQANQFIDRVKKQKAPVGIDQTPITIRKFVYHCDVKKDEEGRRQYGEGTTDVYDALNHLTKYDYDKDHRLTAIKYYTGTKDHQPHCKEGYVWGENHEKSFLVGKYLEDDKGYIHHARYYQYDKFGNVISEKLCGSLTGLKSPRLILNSKKHLVPNHYEAAETTYTYSTDGRHLKLSEVDSNGKKTIYHYYKGTELLAAKYIEWDGHIGQREFYAYNRDWVLTQKISDDGSTEQYNNLKGVTHRFYTIVKPRKNRPLGLPDSIEEWCLDLVSMKKKRIRSRHFDYTREGRGTKEEVYDNENTFQYALTWDYDDHGNVITETNALGEVTEKKYDLNDNLKSELSLIDGSQVLYDYDYSDRLIKKEEIHRDGRSFITHYGYDYLSNCTKTTDSYDNTTHHCYDEFGRVVSIEYPPALDENGLEAKIKIRKTYDIAGNVVCESDPKGNETLTEYNSRGQPTKITYPDGTKERFNYRLDGKLVLKVEKNGTSSKYALDKLGRPTKESVYSADGKLNKQVSNVYNAVHLIKSVDAEGLVTTYKYNPEGLLEWTYHGAHAQQHIYDSLGRIKETRDWFGDNPQDYGATKRSYDLLDRLISETVESSDGTLLHLSSYEYDSKGNCIVEKNGDQVTRTDYNDYHQAVKITNALGHFTRIDYDTHVVNAMGQKVLQITATDPLGYQEIQTYDAVDRLVKSTRRNPLGTVVSKQTIFYDLCGNPCRVVDHVMENGKTCRKVETRKTYSNVNEIRTLTEAADTPEEKVTKFHYNQFGQRSEMVKPDGTKLFYFYDELGRLKSLNSHRSAIHPLSYLYQYNRCDQIESVKDLVSGQETLLNYNPQGELISETLGNGLEIQYQYDRLGRKTRVVFPDQTGIDYVYDAVDLKEVHRLKNGQKIYSHVDLTHDLIGNVTHAKPAYDNGYVDYDYDSLGRCTKITSPFFQQHIPQRGFDKAGNLRSYTAQGIQYDFGYDDHYHLITETGHREHAYFFDSLGNRIRKDEAQHAHNSLHDFSHIFS